MWYKQYKMINQAAANQTGVRKKVAITGVAEITSTVFAPLLPHHHFNNSNEYNIWKRNNTRNCIIINNSNSSIANNCSSNNMQTLQSSNTSSHPFRAARLPSGYTKGQINRYGTFCLSSLRVRKHFKHVFPDAFVGNMEG